jgi:hypothetical protein
MPTQKPPPLRTMASMSTPQHDSESVPQLSHEWTTPDYLGAWKVRWGFRRNIYRIDPGLYRIGDPGPDDPVLVTCNYKLTVDVVRRDLAGVDVWLLVLDTRGVNVWCAAGKKTFGTDEMIDRLMSSELPLMVNHTTIVAPQLGATGVAAHEVSRATGWKVVFGPVRSADLPAYLSAGMKATPEMRAVTFTFTERAVLFPVELTNALRGTWIAAPIALAALGLAITVFRPGVFGAPSADWLPLAAYAAGIVGGTVIVPLALPWLPGRAFGTKGAFSGALAGAAIGYLLGAGWAAFAASVLAASSLSSYLGMNFTGSTPYTSPSGVERELKTWLPIQAVAMIVALLLLLVQSYLR